MSTLRKCLRKPESYLFLLLGLTLLAAADSVRPPSEQWTARVYIATVHLYQETASPHLGGLARCRFEPTCSHYSEEAVARFGIRRGLILTAGRLWRCRSSVPLGTRDPVPESNQREMAEKPNGNGEGQH